MRNQRDLIQVKQRAMPQLVASNVPSGLLLSPSAGSLCLCRNLLWWVHPSCSLVTGLPPGPRPPVHMGPVSLSPISAFSVCFGNRPCLFSQLEWITSPVSSQAMGAGLWGQLYQLPPQSLPAPAAEVRPEHGCKPGYSCTHQAAALHPRMMPA